MDASGWPWVSVRPQTFSVFSQSLEKKKRCFSVRPQQLCFVEGHLRASTAPLLFFCNASRTKRPSTRLILVDGGPFRATAARHVFFAAFLGRNERVFKKRMKTRIFGQQIFLMVQLLLLMLRKTHFFFCFSLRWRCMFSFL